jgi:hypothetical protein
MTRIDTIKQTHENLMNSLYLLDCDYNLLDGAELFHILDRIAQCPNRKTQIKKSYTVKSKNHNSSRNTSQ